MHQRAGHALVELVRAEARAGRAGKRRIELAHLEQRQRLDVGIIADIEGRNAGMQAAAARLFFIGALRLVFFVDGERDALAPDLAGHRHHGVRRLRKRRMVVVSRGRFRFCQIGHVDDAEAAVPAARPHLIAEAQRVVQPVPLAGPARLFAGRDILPGHPPARDFARPFRIVQIVDHQDIADEALHLGGDVGVALVHVEAVHADAAGQLMMDQRRLCRIGDVVDAEAAIAIGLLFRRFDLDDIGLGDVEFLRQLGARRLAAKRLAQFAAHARHLLGAPPDRRRIALVIDHHQIAGDAHLVAVRGRIVERDGRHQPRIGRIGDVDDRGAELLLVRNVPDISVIAGDGDLPGAGQIEMAQAPHIARQRAARPIDFIHFPA